MSEKVNEKKYPIAEIFTSPQGEGVYTGTMMTFIRLAGCSVGKPYPKSEYEKLPVYTEKCTLYDGREFPCDTDYRVKERLTVKEILDRIPEGVGHACISGGEPMIHDLDELVLALFARLPLSGDGTIKHVHLETSGTKRLEEGFPQYLKDPMFQACLMKELWLTVSPKQGCLKEVVVVADEIKLLIDENFDITTVSREVWQHPVVYIQPVNYENAVNKSNLKRVMDLQRMYPRWRVSLQLHKVLSDYIGEMVR